MEKKVKKSKKVNKKKVKSKKQKKIKKKQVKKKTKKKIKKKQVKKKKKRKKRKKMTMEQVYKQINKAQMKKKEVNFPVELKDAAVVEHLIKDAELDYKKYELKTMVKFIIYPPEEEHIFEMLEIEYLQDEIPEDGQLFS